MRPSTEGERLSLWETAKQAEMQTPQHQLMMVNCQHCANILMMSSESGSLDSDACQMSERSWTLALVTKVLRCRAPLDSRNVTSDIL